MVSLPFFQKLILSMVLSQKLMLPIVLSRAWDIVTPITKGMSRVQKQIQLPICQPLSHEPWTGLPARLNNSPPHIQNPPWLSMACQASPAFVLRDLSSVALAERVAKSCESDPLPNLDVRPFIHLLFFWDPFHTGVLDAFLLLLPQSFARPETF